ncbi:MAG: Coenzyme F420-dependent oxidoreductase [uncultured Thermomicrobiales bacterium]|uniref:Coenzyme F420-dependent oxidoreductase n=1 Tax=uncultured Thermomicrobiales bacterium TaxID=1645740 RepID=A0A6J4U8X4_9BACT|nr:MAG: Coenzyme F420-dependent oxidoreductase [uncultured Thermomicrobiales bacterium]
MALSVGIKTSPQHTTYDAMLKVWQEAEQIPSIEHAWLFDHFAPIQGDVDGPCLEGWTVLAAFAAVTQRLRLGLMVTGNTYRHPAVLAKIAATVDVISGGRLDFGIGAGWNVYEHESMGIPLYKPGERIRRLDEACEVIKRLFTQPTVDFDGRYYQLADARSEPKPVHRPYPPFVIGGSGEQLTLRVVAKHADIWNYTGGSVDEFSHKIGVLHDHCAAVDRDPAEIVLSYQYRLRAEDLASSVSDVQRFVDAGATHLVFVLPAPYPDGIVSRVAEEVIAKVTG